MRWRLHVHVQGHVEADADQSPLNLSIVGVASRPSLSNPRDVTDEDPEVTRRRKAELMAALRLADTAAGRRRLETPPPTPEVETSTTDWNGNHLLYEPPPNKRARTVDDEDEEEEEEAEAQEECEESAKNGRSSLLSVLAACSFTDIYNAYQRRQARRLAQLETDSSAGNESDSAPGSGMTAEVLEYVVDGTPAADRKSMSPTVERRVVPADGELTGASAAVTGNGVYPLADRYAFQRGQLFFSVS